MPEMSRLTIGIHRFIFVVFLSLAACTASPYRHVPMAAPHSYADGEEALMKGDYEEAVRQLNAYLASGRRTYRARAYYQLARTHYHREDYGRANLTLSQLGKEFPGFGTKQTLALQGDLAYAQGNRIDGILLWEDSYASATANERLVLEPRIATAMRTLSLEEANQLAPELTVPLIYDMAIDRLSGPAVITAPASNSSFAASEVFYPGEIVISDADIAARPVAPEDLTPAQLEALRSSGAVVSGNRAIAIDSQPQAAGEIGYAPVGTVVETYQIDENGVARIVEGSTVEPDSVPIEAAGVESAYDSDTIAIDDDGLDGRVVAAIDNGVQPTYAPAVTTGPQIAALLPLTGAGRSQGQQALVALRASFDREALMIRDTGSSPSEASALLQHLASDTNVIAVIGPILPKEISNAQREAARLGLPILPLQAQPAPRTSVASSSAALAKHAIDRLGLKRVGIITPDAGGSADFSSAVTSHGGQIVGVHTYATANIDPDAVMSAVQEWTDGGGVEAVYIPDRAARATEIATAARAVAPNVTLLGSSAWNDPEALTSAGSAIDGAIIAGASGGSAGDLTATIEAAARALGGALIIGTMDRTQASAALAQITNTNNSEQRLMELISGRLVTAE